jgi:hypothetical protein
VLLRAFTAGAYCSFISFIDFMLVAVASCGVCLACIFPSIEVIGTSSVLLTSVYPAKQLVRRLVDAKCSAEVDKLDINESYSIEGTPREESYLETPEAAKASEVEILCKG